MTKWLLCPLFLCFSLTLVGCSKDAAKPPASEQPNPFYVPDDWDPDSIDFKCKDANNCPSNHGLLLVKRGPNEVFRCTAFLYSSTKLLTAGHCMQAYEKTNTAYFITHSTAAKKSQLAKIKAKLKMVFDPNDKSKPDYAALELAKPIVMDTYAQLHKGFIAPTDILNAIVVNSQNDEQFTLDVVPCKTSTKDWNSPTDVNDNQTGYSVKCLIHQGNSGGALTYKNNYNQIVGILQTSSSTEKTEEHKKALEKYFGKSKWDLAGVTNTRCLDVPEWPSESRLCKLFDDKARAEKIQQLNRKFLKNEIMDLVKKESRWAQSTDKKTKALFSADFLLSDHPVQGTVLHIIPFPICVERGFISKVIQAAKIKNHFYTFDYENAEVFNLKRKSATDVSWTITPDGNSALHAKISYNTNSHDLTDQAKKLLEPFVTGETGRDSFCKGRDLENHLQNVLENIDKVSI